MEPGDHSSQSPSRSYFDAAAAGLFGHAPFAAASPYGHLAHMPSAFSMMGRHPFPPPFGGLGVMGDAMGSPLRSPGSLSHSLSPTTGGAEWWRCASEHARRLAGGDFTSALVPSLTGLPPCGDAYDALYQHMAEAKTMNGLFAGSMFQLPNLSTTATSSISTTTSSSVTMVSSPDTKLLSSSSRATTPSSTHKSSTGSSRTDGLGSPKSLAVRERMKEQHLSSLTKSSEKKDYERERERTHHQSHNTEKKERERRESEGSGHSKYVSSTNSKTSLSASSQAADVVSMYSSADMLASSLYAQAAAASANTGLFPGAPGLFPYPFHAGGLFPMYPAMYHSMSMMPEMAALTAPHSHSSSSSSPASKSSSSTTVSKASTTKATTTTTSVVSSLTSSMVGGASSKSNSTSSTSKSLHSGSSTGRKQLFSPEPTPPLTPKLSHSSPSSSSSLSVPTSVITSAHQSQWADLTQKSHTMESHKVESAHKSSHAAGLSRQSLPEEMSLDLSMKSSTPSSNKKAKSGAGESDSELSSGSSLSDDSDISDDESNKGKSPAKKKDQMPLLEPVKPSKSLDLQTRTKSKPPPLLPVAHSNQLTSPNNKEPILDNDGVQDLSMKKPPPPSPRSPINMSKKALSDPSVGIGRTRDKHSSVATSSTTTTSPASSAHSLYSSLLSGEAAKVGELSAHELMMSQHKLMASQMGKIPAEYLMLPFMPAAAMLPNMLETHGLFGIPPPPPSSSQVRGRGRGRGRRGRGASRVVDSGTQGLSNSSGSSGRGRGRKRGRGSSLAARMLGMSDGEAAAAELRSQLEAQLKSHNLQQKLKKKAEELRDQQLALQHASRNDHNSHLPSATSSSTSQSKLAAALLGQNSLHRSLPPHLLGSSKVSRISESSEAGNGEESLDSNSDSNSDKDSSSGSDSESESGDSDSDHNTQDSEASGTPSRGEKRSASSLGGSPRKRRRHVEVDEKEIRIPFEHSWRRETRIRGMGGRGIIGEVVYFAPCGKKLKTYQEVLRYLERNGITDLQRENFSFSTKVLIGEFFEIQPGKNDKSMGTDEQNMIPLSEIEVAERVALMEQHKQAKMLAKAKRRELRAERRKQAEEMSRRMAEAKLQKKMEQQEMARRVAELKLRRKLERQQAKEAARRAKQLRVMELKKIKERERLMREQEKYRRQEQLRMEREMRIQQVIEEREMKRQQAVLMKEQERERRRQHMVLVKALETRKKQEERERMREERRAEKMLTLERKKEQRKAEMEIANELRKPIDDMRLKDQQEFPKLKRLTGVRLAGRAFSDALMVFEFLCNFGAALGFDQESLPTMDGLQRSLLYEEDHQEELVNLVCHLLRLAIDDPGFPNPKEALTENGEKIGEFEPNEDTVSELLRLFIKARNGKDNELSLSLRTCPFQALNPTEKAAILAFLCNELLCSKNIVSEIDKNIETMANMRRDKWVVEGKLRKIRMIQAKRFRRVGVQAVLEEKSTTDTQSKRGSDDDDDNESGNESDATNLTATVSDGEDDENIPQEELEKKIDKLSKQHSQFRDKVFRESQKLRGISFGQDRYKRRYWVLPHAGGIYVEGMESAELPEDQEPSSPKEENSDEADKQECRQDTKPEVKAEEKEKDNSTETDNVKVENSMKTENSIVLENSATVENSIKMENSVKTENPNKVENSEENSIKVESSVKVENSKKSSSEEKTEATIGNGMKGLDSVSKQVNGVVDEVMPLNIKHDMENGPSVHPKSIPTTEMNGHIDPQEQNDLKKVKNELLTPAKQEENGDSMKLNCITIDKINSEVKPEKLVNGSMESAFKTPTTNSNSASLHKTDSAKLSELFNISKTEPEIASVFTSSHSLFNHTHNNSLKSPGGSAFSPMGESKSAFRSIDSILGNDSVKTSSPLYYSNSFFSPGLMSTSSSPMSAEQMLKNLSGRISASQQSEWFSILPKMPCDESSLTRSPGDSTPSRPNGESIYSTPGGSYDTSMLCGTPVDFGSFSAPHSTSASPSPLSSAFLRPSTPSSLSLTPGGPMEQKPSVDDLQHKTPQRIPLALQRGWWRITKPEELKAVLTCLHQRGIRERQLQRNYQRYVEYAHLQCSDKDVLQLEETDSSKAIASSATGAPAPDSWNDRLCGLVKECENSILDEVESLEERIYNASLQVKGWKMPPKVSEEEGIELVSSHLEGEIKDNQRYIVQVAKERLLALERNIERRYLKPPFGKGIKVNLANMGANHDDAASSDDEDCDENATNALLQWRRAVDLTKSAAQLTIYLAQLNRCIAWEKSIMKVSCRICCKDDNEAELLLCDSCDKGYHTYCFKPKMEKIPEGDWYCYECISKTTGEPLCVVCGKKGPKLAECDKCPRAMHIDCMEPPMQRMPRKWSCMGCASGKGRKRKGYVASKDDQSDKDSGDKSTGDSNMSDSQPTPEKKSCSNPSPKVSRIRTSTNMAPCRSLLLEMEKHDEAWPFLSPVNTKQFPSYKKVIKHPMDYSTMKIKLRDNMYKTQEEFANDARLVFDNCQTFNEDDSEVGIAGHTMRSFFEHRWREMSDSDSNS